VGGLWMDSGVDSDGEVGAEVGGGGGIATSGDVVGGDGAAVDDEMTHVTVTPVSPYPGIGLQWFSPTMYVEFPWYSVHSESRK